jgi:hypothetical protein
MSSETALPRTVNPAEVVVSRRSPWFGRLAWFAGGLAVGGICGTVIGTVLGAAAVASQHAAAAAGGSAGSAAAPAYQPEAKSATVTRPRVTQKKTALDFAYVASLARLTSRPLVTQSQSTRIASDAEHLAVLATNMEEAERITSEGGPGAAIAQEYLDTLTTFQAVLAETPSLRPLANAGFATLQGSRDNDDHAFMEGIASLTDELSKLNDFKQRLETVHSRLVACRIRVLELANKVRLPEATGDTVEPDFIEAGSGSAVAHDTLYIKNISGERLTKVILALELVGQSGEAYSNCFFADSWEPGQTLLAICRSDSPTRETVSQVRRVRFRIITAERSSRAGELEI